MFFIIFYILTMLDRHVDLPCYIVIVDVSCSPGTGEINMTHSNNCTVNQ